VFSLTVAAVVLTLFLARASVMTAIGVVILLVLLVIFVMMPFESCERLVRARRRRNECVFCGGAVDKRSSENSKVCSCHADGEESLEPQNGLARGSGGREKQDDA
jgi:histone acetyltransferase (RNA polymerase elongator complex component)